MNKKIKDLTKEDVINLYRFTHKHEDFFDNTDYFVKMLYNCRTFIDIILNNFLPYDILNMTIVYDEKICELIAIGDEE